MKLARSHTAGLLAGTVAVVGVGLLARASDHDDTPLLKTMPRHDARLTDLFAFTRGENLVLVVCLDPTVPPAATSYVFASDLTVTINVDTKRAVRFVDADDLAAYGGTILDPEKIEPDIVFEITVDALGQAHLSTRGLSRHGQWPIQFFAGLRDDPFIRGPRIGRNVPALVVELPARAVVGNRPRPVLIWANSRVDDIMGPFQEHAGRSLRSQFVENDPLNLRTPAEHAAMLGVVPDVVILDTSVPVAFPNGRELTDDVVDLVGDARVLNTDAPFPAANDVPFLTTFPYLAEPHPAP